MNLDVRVLELLTSRICHDLVSPIGAVGNGVELLTELGSDGVADSLPLLDHAARQASVRLQIFRLAFGAGGSESTVTGKMVYEAFKNYIFADEKLHFRWDLMMECPDESKTGFFKVLTNALLLAKETLPRGGELVVRLPEGTNTMTITTTGAMLLLKPETIAALNGDVAIEDLDSKSIAPYMAGVFARHFGLSLTARADETAITFEMTFQ